MSAPSAPAHIPASSANSPLAQHLVIPFAHTGGDGEPPLAPLPTATQLPHLRRLLATATVQQRHTVPLDSLTPPHEWALAHARGLTTGHPQLDALPANTPARPSPATVSLPSDRCLPWAAWDVPHLLPTPHTPAAWFTPCHQEVGAHHVSLAPPATLDVSEAHSRALMAALAPLALEDGIHLTWVAPDRWLATGNVLAHVHAASLDRVAGRSIGPWVQVLPPLLRRLQSEAQMLFYTHAAHDARVADRLAPVNAFWVSGSGTAPASNAAAHGNGTPSPSRASHVTVLPMLRDAALAGDAAAWLAAWTDIDQRLLPAWLSQASAGEAQHIHLCGEQGWLHLHLGTQPLWQRLSNKINDIFASPRLFSNISSL